MLLEAAGDPVPLSRIPIAAAAMQFTRNNWNYFTEPQENACRGYIKNRCPVVRGKAFGGSSQVNYMIYSRGHPKDYDRWAEMGNEGWSYKEVLKYFMKSEKSHMKRNVEQQLHGTKGLQDTQFAQWEANPLVKEYLNAWKEMGYKEVDYNGHQQVGYSEMQTFTVNGERADVVLEFLKPIQNRTNLTILKKSFVTKILINDNKKAYGVEYVRRGKRFKATASKEVIISAGVINTPQLLMLSGIGLQDDLTQFGIPLIANLSVGKNLQEHVVYPGFIFKHKSLSSSPLNPLYALQWFFTRKGPWTTSGGVPAVAFTNTTDPKNDYPDSEYPLVLFSFAKSIIIENPKLNYAWYFLKHFFTPSFTVLPAIMKPKSRGYIKLRSTNPFEHPAINPNYLKHPDDTETMIRMIKHILKVVESEPMRKLGVEVVREKLPDCKEYEYGSDEYWVCAVRHVATSYYHHSGSCKMGPKEDTEAVVDPKLQVYGVENLRVADTSIIPLLPNCHTHAVGLMIGEKASDMIKEKWI